MGPTHDTSRIHPRYMYPGIDPTRYIDTYWIHTQIHAIHEYNVPRMYLMYSCIREETRPQVRGNCPCPGLKRDGHGAADGADAPLVVGATVRELASKGLANVLLTRVELRSAARCSAPLQHTFPRSSATPRSTRSLYLQSLYRSQRRSCMNYDGKVFGDMFHYGLATACGSASHQRES